MNRVVVVIFPMFAYIGLLYMFPLNFLKSMTGTYYENIFVSFSGASTIEG